MRIGILQGNESHCRQIEYELGQCGHICKRFTDGVEILEAVDASTVDMLVLDWGGTRLAGIEVLSTLRVINRDGIPVLFASEEGADARVALALSIGADDYITLPLSPPVFRAHINALVRRAFPARERPLSINAGAYRFDARHRSVTVGDKKILLSATQFRLASLFFANVGRVLSRDYIYDMIWGRKLRAVTRTIDNHVSRLRVLLEIDERNGFRLQPVYGDGYRLVRLEIESRDDDGRDDDDRACSGLSVA